MKKTEKKLTQQQPESDPAQLSLEMERIETRALNEARAAGMTTPITLVALAKLHDLLDHLDTDPAWREVVVEYRALLPERSHA